MLPFSTLFAELYETYDTPATFPLTITSLGNEFTPRRRMRVSNTSSFPFSNDIFTRAGALDGQLPIVDIESS
jgi:hypothetical protein